MEERILSEGTGTGNSYIVKPVYKALNVLWCVGERGGELTLTEVSRYTGLNKTTVYRYLHTLAECGFLVHDRRNDTYRLGLRVWELGRLVGADLRIREVALPVMQELRDTFNETVNLGVLDGKEVVYVEMVESGHALSMRARVGGRDPAYSTSLGKAILAFLPEREWRNHLPSRLVSRTSRTHTSLRPLRADLVAARARGFALDRGENEEDAHCIGAPIFDQSGTVVAAISVSAPASRLPEALQPEVASAVIRAARTVSERLGYTPDDAREASGSGGQG
jgi:IclR family KDG regulon transcriptional repressor